MTFRISNEPVKQAEQYAFAKGAAFVVTCMIDYFRLKAGRTESLAIYLLRRLNVKLGASFREVLRTGQFQASVDKFHNELKIENPTPEQKESIRLTLKQTLALRRLAYSKDSDPTPEGAD